MISNTIYSKGRDNFKDYTFSAREWSAPTMVSPKEIRERIDSFALCGRKIKRMRLIGLSDFHTRDWVEEAAYRQVEHLPEEARQRKSNYSTIDPTMQFSRYAQIDEPFLIEFEDGDVFEVDTPQDPEFRMSMNCIPWWIKAGTNQPNVEADILFSPCVGQEIVSVEVNTRITDKDPMFFCAFNEPPYQRELVSNVTLRLRNGLGLQISPDIDYCEVACVDVSNEWVKISFSELKDALFNWEDLHDDEVTDFENGIAIVAKGKWTIDPKWDNKYNQGRYWTEEELWGAIDKDGNEVIPFIFDEIKHFFDRSDMFMVHYGGWKDGHWGVVDCKGNWLAEPTFEGFSYETWKDRILFYAEDPDATGDGLPMGIYDLAQKKVLFEPQFLDVTFRDNGDMEVEVFDEELGRTIEKIIDPSGKERFKSIYSSIYTWHDLYEVVIRDKDGARHGLIDKEGNEILPCIYDVPWNGFYHEQQRICFVENGKQGMKDYDGNIIIPAIYHEIHGRKDPYLTVRVGEKDSYKEGLITYDGKTVIEANHSRIGWCSDHKHFFCCADGRCEMYVVEDCAAILSLCRDKGRKRQLFCVLSKNQSIGNTQPLFLLFLPLISLHARRNPQLSHKRQKGMHFDVHTLFVSNPCMATAIILIS